MLEGWTLRSQRASRLAGVIAFCALLACGSDLTSAKRQPTGPEKAAAATQAAYPSPAEAKVAYDWLHKRVVDWLNRNPRWAIDELGAAQKTLPSGVLAEYRLTRGWATFGLAMPHGQATHGLKVGSLETQTDVKVRWPDGTVRFAIVTAKVPEPGMYAIRPVPLEGAARAAEGHCDGRVLLRTRDDGEYSAALPAAESSDVWLSGPLVTEWRWNVTPVDSAARPHKFLRLLFDCRVYHGGGARLDVTVENVLDHQRADTVVYDVQVVIKDRVAFEKRDVSHWYLTRWRKIFAIDLSESEVEPDFEPFHRARALPRYLSSIENEVRPTDSPTYEILGRGGNAHDNMSSTGGRDELGPYPGGTARYIVHGGSAHREWLLRNGDLAGSWPVHVRELDGSLVSIEERSAFWLDSRGDDQPAGNRRGTGPLGPDNAHQPSWPYVPYLVTGDRYYADEMAFWANYVLLDTWPHRRGTLDGTEYGGEGLLRSAQPRSFGWGIRTMADAAAYLPDSHPLKAYFIEKVQNNLAWSDDYADAYTGSPLGLKPLRFRKEDDRTVAMWMHNYLGWGLDHANQQGFAGGGRWIEALAGFQTKLFTSDAAGYPRENGAPYSLEVLEKDEAGEWRFLETMAELGRANPDASNWNRDYAGSARLMLMIAAREGSNGERAQASEPDEPAGQP